MPDEKKRTNWKKTAVEEMDKRRDLLLEHSQLQEAYKQLEAAHKELKAKGLGPRDAVKLRRYQHLISRLVNLPVAKEARVTMDKVIDEELKHIKKEIWGDQ